MYSELTYVQVARCRKGSNTNSDARLLCSKVKYTKSIEGRVEVKPTITYFELSSMQDYPLNLSILLSGGKETNKDCLSNGE